MNLREAAQQALDALEVADSWGTWHRGSEAITVLRAALSNTQDWDEIEALRESLREHMAEIKRLNDCLIWEQNRAEHVGTHGPGCAEWGPRHYECLLRAYNAMKERTSQESRQVEPVAWITPGQDLHLVNYRGVEAVTDCHEKEGDKLAFPLPTLAVHVGYRYQSPVGDWEYGDHIPAGFDTDKWAHQKIYILQEQ